MFYWIITKPKSSIKSYVTKLMNKARMPLEKTGM